MASGKDKSSDGDEKNPFSYQNFVKKKSDGDIDSGSSDDDSSNDNQKLSSESALQKDVNNPYSFRKFLVKDAPPSNASPRPAGCHNFMPDTYDSIPDITSGLPDFVQDQAHHDSARRGSNNGRIRSANDLSLPDFVIGTNDVPSTADSNSTYSGVFPSINAIGSLIGRDEGPVYSKNRPSSSGNRVRQGAMPFLESTDDEVLDINDDSAIENRRLREENAALRRQLLETRDLARHESERVAQLVHQVKALQNHEADETAALEKMVQKIESNLETATERAVKAESIITKQKQEIKLLREQLKNSEMTNGAVSEPLDEVRDQTRYMSQQLAGAASNAEVTLKQMMGGVENLKLMSEIILSIGKIYENPEEEEQGKSRMKQEESKPKETEKPEESKPKAATSSSSSNNSQTVKNSKSDKSKESTEDVRPKSKVDSSAKKKTTPKPTKDSDKIKK